MKDAQWISYKVGSETFANAINQIKEIIPYKIPVPVPGAPTSAEGILNVRGNIVTVLSSRALLNFEEEATEEDRRVIILELGTEQLGLSVDSVGEIFSFPPEEVEWIDQNSQNPNIQGTVQKEGQLYILTDFTNSLGESFKDSLKTK